MYRVVFNCPHLFSTAKKIANQRLLDEEFHGIATLVGLKLFFFLVLKLGGASQTTPCILDVVTQHALLCSLGLWVSHLKPPCPDSTDV